MTITLTTQAQAQAKTTNLKSQREKIVNKLNNLVSSANFFRVSDTRFIARGCANVHLHSKLMLFMSLFADSHHETHESYTGYGYGDGMQFTIPNSLLDKLEITLDAIEKVSDINITIN